MLDTFLAWSIILLPIILSVAGVVVSITAPQSHHKKFWYSGLVTTGVLLSVLTWWQQERSQGIHDLEIKGLKDQLNAIDKNTKQPPRVEVNVPPPQVIIQNGTVTGVQQQPRNDGFLQLERQEFSQYPPTVAVGNKLSLNYHFVNRGNRPVRGARAWGFLIPADIAANGPNPDAKIWGICEKSCKQIYHHVSGKGGVLIGVNQEFWGTAVSQPLTDSDVKGIFNDTVRLYSITVAIWKSENGEEQNWSVCNFAHNISPDSPSLVNAIWHNCDR
jgi:hypothetical protein